MTTGRISPSSQAERFPLFGGGKTQHNGPAQRVFASRALEGEIMRMGSCGGVGRGRGGLIANAGA